MSTPQTDAQKNEGLMYYTINIFDYFSNWLCLFWSTTARIKYAAFLKDNLQCCRRHAGHCHCLANTDWSRMLDLQLEGFEESLH